jgi:hypothetical protein
MGTISGRQIGNCPKCNAVIREQHSSYWCAACGEMLPDDILAQLPQVVGTPADTPPQRAPAVPAASDAADKHIRNAWIAAAVSAAVTVGLVIYKAGTIMIAFGYILVLIGNVTGVIGLVLLLRAAYRQGLGWLVGCLVLPPLWLVLLMFHFRHTIRPFALFSLGVIRVYDESGNVIETHEHAGVFKDW